MFVPFQKKDILALTKERKFETKIGEKISVGNVSQLSKKGVKFVIFGVEESIGPRANMGRGGSERAWFSFLNSFLNTQKNKLIDVSKIGILGSFKFSSNKSDLNFLREITSEIDSEVKLVVEKIISFNMIPILIGGGHNNAFPLISGFYSAKGHSLNVINCDPHADLRPIEGRHSGNSFSYAINSNYLEKYYILGLHQNYVSNNTFTTIEDVNKKKERIRFSFYDDWIYGDKSFEKDLSDGINFIDKKKYTGIEFDMDSIAYMPSSAVSPCGISLDEARIFISLCSKNLNAAYLHLPEAAPKNKDEEIIVGKALTYLVIDFIKITLNKKNR